MVCSKLKAGILRFHTLKTPLITANFTVGEKLRTALTGAPRLNIDQLAPQVRLSCLGFASSVICSSVRGCLFWQQEEQQEKSNMSCHMLFKLFCAQSHIQEMFTGLRMLSYLH